MGLPLVVATAAALLGLVAASAGCRPDGPACPTAPDEGVLLQLQREQGGIKTAASAASSWRQADGRIPVWIWWDYDPKAAPGWGLPAYQEALVNSWKRFAPSDLFAIHYINHSNILEFLPDFPEETKRMYVEAKTDVIRTGLLASHGGVYFDADFLLARPLKEVTDKLEEVDFVTYSGGGQSCQKHGTFSSNFMAARKGNTFSTAWYEKQKKDVKQRCEPGDIFYQPVCCYTPEGAERECHIPWGRLGEGNGRRILRDLLKIPQDPKDRGTIGWSRQTAEDAQVSFHCFSEDEDKSGFAPFESEGLWGTLAGQSMTEEPLSTWNCEASGEDLSCTRPDGWVHHAKNFFCRHAYHFFTKGSSPQMKNQQYLGLKQKPWVMAKLLRKIEGDEERNCVGV